MMEIRTRNEGSELVDPLVDKSSLSLFPHNFNLSSLSSSAPISNPNSSIYDSLDAQLKARVLSSPDKLLKQTKTILEENVLTEKQKVPRERRPGLGLKRAKFSAKPIPSQPAASLDFSIDVEKLSDPEEYFAAFERMENAKKEVQRLNGEPVFPLFDLDQNRVSSAPRRRRPSLLGKSATFANRFHSSKALTDVDETPLSSKETFDNGIRSPTHNDVLPDAKVINSSPNVREPESKPMKNSKVSELDELLSSNYDQLDENERHNILREKLQIKNVDIGKAFFSNWRVQLRESWTSSSGLQKRNDVIVQQFSKSKTTRSGDHVSPAKSRSPLAAISLLNRHISRRSPSMDQFSPLQIDLSPAETTNFTSEPEIRVDRAGQSDEVDARENLHEFRRPTAHEKENNAASWDDTFVSVANDVDPISDPKEKEDVVGQFDSVSNKTDSCEIRRSSVHVENHIAGSVENGTASASSGDDTFVSVANDVDPISDPKEKEDVVGQCDAISNKTVSCEFRRSPVHVENHIAGSVENVPALASSGDNTFVSVTNDVDPISDPKVKEDVVGQCDSISNKTDSCEFRRSPVHVVNHIAGSVEDGSALASIDVGPTSEPEKLEDEVDATLTPGQQLISEGLDKEKSSFDGVEKGGAGDLSNAENISVEEPTEETVRSSKRRLKEKEISEVPSETVVSERTVRFSKRRIKEKEIPEVPSETVVSERTVRSSKRSLKEKEISEVPSETVVSERTVRSSKRRLKEKEIPEVPSETVVSERAVNKGQQAKEIQSEAPVSGEARNKRRKVEGARPGTKKRSKELRRTSLYCAGTNWEAGVRRSTRIRMRPLEYWRGERFLYGRVHESLVTVIGVKYASPSKSKDAEEPGVKVKSFVSDKYKDLVELAALH